MREILFRGKRLDNDEWVEGFYSTVYFGNGREPAIIPDEEFKWEPFRVNPETVGQYTGLTDKNGKKIFEGDIVKYGNSPCLVVFEQRNGTAYFGIVISEIETYGFGNYASPDVVEVIGNIYDNPELLEVEE